MIFILTIDGSIQILKPVMVFDSCGKSIFINDLIFYDEFLALSAMYKKYWMIMFPGDVSKTPLLQKNL